jgi:hypothetical protein
VETPPPLGLKEALDLEAYFLDGSCLKANVHFPTDWVLLRDGVRTLMKATWLIRQAGLRGRMQAPEQFLRCMNRLSIEMTQQARRAGRKKGRKRVLSQMKKLVNPHASLLARKLHGERRAASRSCSALRAASSASRFSPSSRKALSSWE